MTPHLEQQLSRTLDFLRSCQQKGMMPTKREIMEHLGIKSSNTVAYYLDKLEKRGKIERDPGKARGIRLTECEGEVVVIRDGYMGICWTANIAFINRRCVLLISAPVARSIFMVLTIQ